MRVKYGGMERQIRELSSIKKREFWLKKLALIKAKNVLQDLEEKKRRRIRNIKDQYNDDIEECEEKLDDIEEKRYFYSRLSDWDRNSNEIDSLREKIRTVNIEDELAMKSLKKTIRKEDDEIKFLGLEIDLDEQKKKNKYKSGPIALIVEKAADLYKKHGYDVTKIKGEIGSIIELPNELIDPNAEFFIEIFDSSDMAVMKKYYPDEKSRTHDVTEDAPILWDQQTSYQKIYGPVRPFKKNTDFVTDEGRQIDIWLAKRPEENEEAQTEPNSSG